jgi:hypothetical protein
MVTPAYVVVAEEKVVPRRSDGRWRPREVTIPGVLASAHFTSHNMYYVNLHRGKLWKTVAFSPTRRPDRIFHRNLHG